MEESMFCRICLVSGVRMYHLDITTGTASGDSLGLIYAELTGIQICSNGHYVCFECAAMLKKFRLFKQKSHRAHRLLFQISSNLAAVTKEMINIHIDRKQYNFESNLSIAETVCYEIDSVCPVFIDGMLNKVDDKLEIEINPGLVFGDEYGDVNLNEEFNKGYLKLETPDLCNDDFQRENNMENLNIVCRNETQSSLVLIKAPADDCDNGTTEYLDENILAEVEEPEVTQYIDVNVPAKVEPVKKFKTKIIKKPVKKEKKTRLPKKKDIKVKTQLKKTHYKIAKADYNKEFMGYGTVVSLTTEEAKYEMLKRKDSDNYKLSPLKCELCFRGFRLKVTYNNHMTRHKEDMGKYECVCCHLRFTNQKLLTKHNTAHHLKKFQCSLCSYVTFNLQRARSHVDHHKGKKYPCLQCGATFDVQNSLFMHRRMKHFNNAVTEVVCELCGDIFASASGIGVHNILMHKLDKNSFQGPKCEECGVHFDSEKAWSRHLVLSSKHAQTLPPNNICKNCGERFSNAHDLKTHARAVHIRKQDPTKMSPRKRYPRVCRQCGKRLMNLQEYFAHLHTEKFVCEVCGLEFKWERLLKEHHLTHTGERPFKCDICNKRYRTKGILANHRKRHECRQHICDICGKNYMLKSSLIIHMKVHVGIRPHKCLMCDKAFIYNYELKMHVKYIHEKVPWPKRVRKRNVTNNRLGINEHY